jgi:hypothetical protein
VIAVLSILLVCSGGGVAAHTISDMETGQPGHSRQVDLVVLAGSALVFLAGMLLY